jgi:hypothetical protein
MTLLADKHHPSQLHVRVRYSLAELVSVLLIVRHADGSQYNCGLLSMPLEDWHATVRPMYVREASQGTVRLDDDTVPNEHPRRRR